MELHMIITISGLFVGMVVLLYGIYSYDKLKKEEQTENKNDDSSNKEEVKEEIKKDDENTTEVKKEEKVNKEEISNDEVKEDKKESKKEVSNIKVEGTNLENKELSDFVNEADLDDTMILGNDKKEDVIQNVTEIPDDDKVVSDVEDLFD